MSNSTVQTALFFDVFLYFFDVSEQLALISLNMVICPVYDFGWPVLGGLKDNSLKMVILWWFNDDLPILFWVNIDQKQQFNKPNYSSMLYLPTFTLQKYPNVGK